MRMSIVALSIQYEHRLVHYTNTTLAYDCGLKPQRPQTPRIGDSAHSDLFIRVGLGTPYDIRLCPTYFPENRALYSLACIHSILVETQSSQDRTTASTQRKTCRTEHP